MKKDVSHSSVDSKMKLMESFGQDSAQRPYFARISDTPMADAFARKAVVHAGLGGKPVPEEERPRVWQALAQTPRRGKTTAYIHIPFCETRCLYCGFFGNPANEENQNAYVDALVKEMAAASDSPMVNSWPVHAVYLGGGTPTALSTRDLKKVLQAARQYLPLANDCEITVEGRVFGFGEDKIAACIDGGANRFSIGVQTFDTKIRQSVGRIQGIREIIACLNALKATDQAAVIIDLIYGLPGQTMETWEKDLDTFMGLEIDGVDLYQLIRFPGGKLDRAIADQKVPPVADRPMRAAMFERGGAIMEQARYRRLSIDHWGRTFRERNLYNRFMKAKTDCLGFGSGAGGFMNGYGYFLEGNLKKYLDRAGWEKPLVHMMKPDETEPLIRIVAGELEMGRINLKTAGAPLDMDMESVFRPLVSQWEQAGLVSLSKGWMTLTRAGEFWQTNLAQGMIDFYKEIVK